MEMEPSKIDNSKLKSIQNGLSNAESSFNAGKILQKNGAIDNAKIAYFDSKEILGERVIINEIIQPDSKFGETTVSKTCLEYDAYSIMSLNVSGIISNEIFSTQKKRIYNALLNSSSEEVINFDNVLSKIIHG